MGCEIFQAVTKDDASIAPSSGGYETWDLEYDPIDLFASLFTEKESSPSARRQDKTTKDRYNLGYEPRELNAPFLRNGTQDTYARQSFRTQQSGLR